MGRIEQIKDAARRVSDLEEVRKTIKEIRHRGDLRSIGLKKVHGPFHDSGKNIDEIDIPDAIAPIMREQMLKLLDDYEKIIQEDIENIKLD